MSCIIQYSMGGVESQERSVVKRFVRPLLWARTTTIAHACSKQVLPLAYILLGMCSCPSSGTLKILCIRSKPREDL